MQKLQVLLWMLLWGQLAMRANISKSYVKNQSTKRSLELNLTKLALQVSDFSLKVLAKDDGRLQDKPKQPKFSSKAYALPDKSALTKVRRQRFMQCAQFQSSGMISLLSPWSRMCMTLLASWAVHRVPNQGDRLKTLLIIRSGVVTSRFAAGRFDFG